MTKKRFRLEINYISLVDLLSGALASFVILFISVPHKEHDYRRPSSEVDSIPKIENVKKGQRFKLEDVNFMGNSTTLYPNSMEQLNRLAKWMKKNSSVEIMIEAHSNPGGRVSDEARRKHLLNLSQDRAQKVYDTLINKGIAALRIQSKGYGGTKPLYENPSTRLEHAKNRRVEFRILAK